MPLYFEIELYDSLVHRICKVAKLNYDGVMFDDAKDYNAFQRFLLKSCLAEVKRRETLAKKAKPKKHRSRAR